jgi:hypothetical protein
LQCRQARDLSPQQPIEMFDPGPHRLAFTM